MRRVKLLIAIPALNEEQSVGETIQRCLLAGELLVAEQVVHSVDVTVVSDGSTDRTVEIARAFVPRITLIDWAENRGYGAAIKAAWLGSDADLLGFLDADGTCDPTFFSVLCRAITTSDADIALGCRLNAASDMPMLRRLGNRFYALLLSLVADSAVRDTASGMRVVRATALGRMLPLPDGLHFTPAMSARAHLGGDIRIVERDMPYAEREGQSKLNVVRDGMRFLDVILRTAGTYRPSRLLAAAGLASLLPAIALMISPLAFFLQNRRLEEGMIYRFLVANLLGLAAVSLLSAGYLAGRMVDLLLFDGRLPSRSRARFREWLHGARFVFVIGALLAAGVAFVLPGLIDRIRTGETSLHWSRFISMSFFYEIALILVVTRLVDSFLDLSAQRLLERKALVSGL